MDEPPYNRMLRQPYRQVSKMFSDRQVDRLIELVRQNEDRLFPNSFNKPNRSTSRRAWTTICNIFNAEFPEDMRTAEQIRVKWKNMRQKARESGQLHLLSRTACLDRRQFDINDEEFSYLASLTRKNEDNAIQGGLNVLRSMSNYSNSHKNAPNQIRNNGIKREPSIMSISSEANSEPTFNEQQSIFNPIRGRSVILQQIPLHPTT